MPMRAHLLAAGVVVSLAALFSPAASAQTSALLNARVIDGRGQVVERAAIIIRDGKIVAVGPVASTTVPAGAQKIDLAGTTIIPGLVNAHGHLSAANGMRNDPNGQSRENQLRQLKAYGQYGITTVF